MKSLPFLLLLTVSIGLRGQGTDEWIPLFDGETLSGWKASENSDSWKIENGSIVTAGARSHLFYAGDVMGHEFKNFEFSADVKTKPGANSGIYIHTEFQDEGWPFKGYECQVINSSEPAEPGAYVEHKMTGSIYAIRNVWKPIVPDEEWFNYTIKVQGKTIQTFINSMLIAEYTEPDDIYRPEGFKGRLLGSGTFALQCHDPGSEVSFKNIRVKPLADNLPTLGSPPQDLEFEKKILELSAQNFPLIDLHTHIRSRMMPDQVIANARKYGYTYGIAVGCGLRMGFETDVTLNKYLDNLAAIPLAYLAMQAEGREWLDLFSRESIARFDYVITDAMTWTNDNGKRMRLWIKQETEVGEPQNFMDQLVDRIVKIVSDEPIDIYVNPTYLPDEIAERYDELWTTDRMDAVITALVKSGVALEINNSLRLTQSCLHQKGQGSWSEVHIWYQ